MHQYKRRRIIVATLIGVASFAISVQSFARIQTLETQSLILAKAISTKPRKLFLHLGSTCIGQLEGALHPQGEGFMYDSQGVIRFKFSKVQSAAIDFSLRLAINGLYQVGGSVLRFWNPSTPEKKVVLGTLGIDPIEVQGSLDGSGKNLVKIPIPGPITLYPTGEGTFGLQVPAFAVAIPLPTVFGKVSLTLAQDDTTCNLTDNEISPSIVAEFSSLLNTATMWANPLNTNSKRGS
jgi:hypothetical protein